MWIRQFVRMVGKLSNLTPAECWYQDIFVEWKALLALSADNVTLLCECIPGYISIALIVELDATGPGYHGGCKLKWLIWSLETLADFHKILFFYRVQKQNYYYPSTIYHQSVRKKEAKRRWEKGRLNSTLLGRQTELKSLIRVILKAFITLLLILFWLYILLYFDCSSI